MNTLGYKLPEIKEQCSRLATSSRRRKTIHVTQRGQTALGIPRIQGLPLQKPLIPVRKASTATSARRTSFTPEVMQYNFEMLDSRRVSCADVTTRLYTKPQVPLKKSSSESDAYKSPFLQVDRRGSLQFKPGAYRSFARSRRASRVHSIPENCFSTKVQIS